MQIVRNILGISVACAALVSVGARAELGIHSREGSRNSVFSIRSLPALLGDEKKMKALDVTERQVQEYYEAAIEKESIQKTGRKKDETPEAYDKRLATAQKVLNDAAEPLAEAVIEVTGMLGDAEKVFIVSESKVLTLYFAKKDGKEWKPVFYAKLFIAAKDSKVKGYELKVYEVEDKKKGDDKKVVEFNLDAKLLTTYYDAAIAWEKAKGAGPGKDESKEAFAKRLEEPKKAMQEAAKPLVDAIVKKTGKFQADQMFIVPTSKKLIVFFQQKKDDGSDDLVVTNSAELEITANDGKAKSYELKVYQFGDRK